MKNFKNVIESAKKDGKYIILVCNADNKYYKTLKGFDGSFMSVIDINLEELYSAINADDTLVIDANTLCPRNIHDLSIIINEIRERNRRFLKRTLPKLRAGIISLYAMSFFAYEHFRRQRQQQGGN